VDRIVVRGSGPLEGSVAVEGAKNSVLKLMAASLMAEGRSVLRNVPRIVDVEIMSDLLTSMGADVRRAEDHVLTIDVGADINPEAPYELVEQMRASIVVLGALLARNGYARVALPGGDNFGPRPIDMHISGLDALGVRFESAHGYIEARCDNLVGTRVVLEFPSVGATENLVMAAVRAKGTTLIDNAAREPEIADLCAMLAVMGAKIDGAGTSTITVEGVPGLSPASYTTVPDRIVAGTWAIGAVMTRGDVVIERAVAEHLTVALDKLTDAGAQVEALPDGIRVAMDGRPRGVDVVTLPYPGFPTDLQPMAIALNAVADGVAFVTENIFEGRFMFIDELVRLGADVRTDGHHAIVRGRERLSGAPVRATDIRAGAGLVLAGLLAEGVTTIADAHHVDRGYQEFVEDLQRLGAQIRRRRDDVLV
jgi:UDP-N-acetylglucosamine 1-carboxyvinyltransferase